MYTIYFFSVFVIIYVFCVLHFGLIFVSFMDTVIDKFGGVLLFIFTEYNNYIANAGLHFKGNDEQLRKRSIKILNIIITISRQRNYYLPARSSRALETGELPKCQHYRIAFRRWVFFCR